MSYSRSCTINRISHNRSKTPKTTKFFCRCSLADITHDHSIMISPRRKHMLERYSTLPSHTACHEEFSQQWLIFPRPHDPPGETRETRDGPTVRSEWRRGRKPECSKPDSFPCLSKECTVPAKIPLSFSYFSASRSTLTPVSCSLHSTTVHLKNWHYRAIRIKRCIYPSRRTWSVFTC